MKQVKQDFKEGIYNIEFKGNMISFTNALGAACELLNSENLDGRISAKVKLAQNISTNDLLKAVVGQVEVFGLQEVIPSMNDIFIKKVGENSIKKEANNE